MIGQVHDLFSLLEVPYFNGVVMGAGREDFVVGVCSHAFDGVEMGLVDGFMRVNLFGSKILEELELEIALHGLKTL